MKIFQHVIKRMNPASPLFLTMLMVCPVFPVLYGINTAFAATATDAKVVQINQGGDSETSHPLGLSVGKAAIVELPVAARDVLLSNPEIVEAVVRTPRRTYIIGLRSGQTNAFFFDARGQQVLNLEISVERDIMPLTEAYREYMPTASIGVKSIGGNVVLSGSVPNAVQAKKAHDIAARFVQDEERVINMLSIEGKEQVMLKVTIAEMQRTLIKQLGLDITNQANLGDVMLNWAMSNSLSLQGRALGGLTTAPIGGPVTTFNNGKGDIVTMGLRAFERAGLLRTLAEPNLTAVSGESARFLAGGEFPVPTALDENGNVTVEFKPFGVGLGFTPVVLDEGRISMQISTEVSELTSQGAFVIQGGSQQDTGISVSALKVRRAETTVELPSGGSLVMAGLISESIRQNMDSIPGVKDVPVLGNLLRSRDFQNDETELVVVVTPYIVEPTSRNNLVLPTDGYLQPTDMDTILLGKLNATYGVASKPRGQLSGPVGFVIE